MSLAADYRKEREGIETIENEHGFITYKLFPEECYVIDIYVRPEDRRTRIGSMMADSVVKIAKEKGCKILTGSIDTRLISCTQSAKALLAYGFRFLRNDGPTTYFFKEVA